jgi:hypothetical protein
MQKKINLDYVIKNLKTLLLSDSIDLLTLRRVLAILINATPIGNDHLKQFSLLLKQVKETLKSRKLDHFFDTPFEESLNEITIKIDNLILQSNYIENFGLIKTTFYIELGKYKNLLEINKNWEKEYSQIKIASIHDVLNLLESKINILKIKNDQFKNLNKSKKR